MTVRADVRVLAAISKGGSPTSTSTSTVMSKDGYSSWSQETSASIDFSSSLRRVLMVDYVDVELRASIHPLIDQGHGGEGMNLAAVMFGLLRRREQDHATLLGAIDRSNDRGVGRSAGEALGGLGRDS
ncbi:hypothetical protein [Brevibacterium sp. 239c]|uniref:hypothetical protein n=1 Tax=Brevibacterium sp. 239c TaxID=1965356 RepID=UPI002153861F|nr:hypothetical protein [Brevibacterium sp. 239c]